MCPRQRMSDYKTSGAVEQEHCEKWRQLRVIGRSNTLIRVVHLDLQVSTERVL